MNTPVTPIMIEAPHAIALREAGYEARAITWEPEDLGIEEDDADDEAKIAAWEPPHPPGDGWILHCKCWTDDASILAIWARPECPTIDG